jgi:dihydroflavonol-4-reductase
VDADDVAAAMIALMQSELEGEKYIVSGENLLYRDLFFMAADALGVQRPHRQVTPLLAAMAWRWEKLKSLLTGKRALVTKETAKTGLAQVSFNNQKLLNALPDFAYQPMQQSIRRICAAYLEQQTRKG